MLVLQAEDIYVLRKATPQFIKSGYKSSSGNSGFANLKFLQYAVLTRLHDEFSLQVDCYWDMD